MSAIDDNPEVLPHARLLLKRQQPPRLDTGAFQPGFRSAMPPPYTRVYPTFESVTDPTFNLPALVEQLVVFLRSADVCPHALPAVKAASVYLAVVEAFEQCGMLAKEHAPDILLEVDGHDYEVRPEYYEGGNSLDSPADNWATDCPPWTRGGQPVPAAHTRRSPTRRQ